MVFPPTASLVCSSTGQSSPKTSNQGQGQGYGQDQCQGYGYDQGQRQRQCQGYASEDLYPLWLVLVVIMQEPQLPYVIPTAAIGLVRRSNRLGVGLVLGLGVSGPRSTSIRKNMNDIHIQRRISVSVPRPQPAPAPSPPWEVPSPCSLTCQDPTDRIYCHLPIMVRLRVEVRVEVRVSEVPTASIVTSSEHETVPRPLVSAPCIPHLHCCLSSRPAPLFSFDQGQGQGQGKDQQLGVWLWSGRLRFYLLERASHTNCL